MPKIIFKNKTIEYSLKRSRRARQVRLAVRADGRVVLSMPWRLNETAGERFIKQKADWILEKIAYFEEHTNHSLTKITAKDYIRDKKKVLTLVEERIEYFNKLYNFKFKRICVKNQRTRWGSCSRQGNLNFNFRIIYLPAVMADYIIVHELCHLAELNHSKRFWDLVAKTMPNYKIIRGELKKVGLSLM